MLSVSQYWKEKLGNCLIADRDLLTPEELVKLVYSIGSETLTFTKEDIISFTHTNSADLNSLSLPKNEIQFEIDNTDGRFNPDNPTGLYEQITEKQEVDLYYGIIAKNTVTNLLPDSAASSVWTTKNFDSAGAGVLYDAVITAMNAFNVYVAKITVSTAGDYVIGFSNCTASANIPHPEHATTIRHYYSVTGSASLSGDYSFDVVAGEVYDHTFDKITLAAGDEITFGCVVNYSQRMTGFYDAPFIYKLPENDVGDRPQPLLGYSTDIKVSEWHKAGTFYMSAWDCPQGGLTATFTATGLLDFGKDKFGEITYSSEPTYADVCETAMTHMGITNYDLDDSLEDYNVPYASSVTTYTWEKWSADPVYATSQESHTLHMSEDWQDVAYNYAVQINPDNPITLDTHTGKFTVDCSNAESDEYAVLGYVLGTLWSYKVGVYNTSQAALTKTLDFYYMPQTLTTYTHFVIEIDTSTYSSVRNANENEQDDTFIKVFSYDTGNKQKGTTQYTDVSSTNANAYPSNGYQDGYWYVAKGSATTYTVDLFKSTTDAAVIQYCANAAMCRIRYDVDGKIYVEPMEAVASLSDYVIDLFTSYKSPEYTLSKQIKNVLINEDFTVALESTGENQQISNSLITSQSHANLVAGWLGRVINTRKEISGEFRCDPRLQPYDYIKSINKYAVNECFITSVTISYSGSFKGTYTGRVMKSIPSEDIYGLFYAGDRQKSGNAIS